MKNQIDLQAKQTHAFNAGQAGRYLIIREASRDVILRSDKLRPLSIERGDTIDVSQFDDLEFYNPWDGSIFVEYQVSDVDIRIKAQSQTVGGVIEVSRIQEGLKVDVPSVDVEFPNSLNVGNLPDVQKVQVQNLPDTQKVEVSNFPKAVDVQKVQVENFADVQKVEQLLSNQLKSSAVNINNAGSLQLLASVSNRKSALIQTDKAIYIGDSGVSASNGIFVDAGETITLETTAQIHAYAPSGANVRILEELRNG